MVVSTLLFNGSFPTIKYENKNNIKLNKYFELLKKNIYRRN